MPHLPITLVETSSKGAVVLIFGVDFHVTDSTGKVTASTIPNEQGDQVAKIETPSKGNIRAAAFSRDGSLFAICTVDKGVYIYETEHWTTVRSLDSEKRSNALAFDPSGEFLVTADKFGDAYRVGTSSDTPAKPQLLLGHVSNLCAIDFSFNERPYVLTCDRDEKLRVSKYPNSYNIQSFGMGHTEFITSVAPARFALDNVVTASGDGTLRLWDMPTGELVQTVEMSKYLAKYYESGAAVCSENTYEDRTAASQRYGVLRVRAVDAIEAFVAVVERIPAVLVFPFCQGKLGEPQVVDIAQPSTDVGVLGDRLVVSYAPKAGGELVVVLKYDGNQYVADDELTAALSLNVTTRETETVSQIPSIFIWGNKMYLERPKGEEGDDQEQE
ncbi:hypothetical protein GGH94_002867 [Coemansia aciculifera]|uniref:Translation initiation factor beta propellor-like domain-containing protein n=1 Tax=Coemansia aciculifera TaxID=417176 RepID=A0A9W8II61_9FUNG|nr:hypothetical protein GGH94_002867 [Coemansia aciculifera]